MNEINPSARMQVRGVGDLIHPGACAVCGNGTCHDGYLDPGVYYDYEGQVYLCMRCVEELIATVGGATAAELLVTADLTTRALDENERLKAEVESLNVELEQYRNLMRVATGGNDDVPDASAIDVPVIEVDGVDEAGDNKVGELPLPDVGEGVNSEPVVNESVKSDGSSNTNRTKRGNGSNSTKRRATVTIDL